MKRIPVPNDSIQLYGLPWYGHNGKRYWRLPRGIESKIPQDLWETSLDPSGARLRFRTDATELRISLSYADLHPSRNMTRIGKMGFDLYADSIYWSSVVPDEKGGMTGVFFEGAPKQMREITIYFPLFYNEFELLGLYADDGAEILPPEPYAISKPVVFYGTSITHGGCASRPGLSYEAVLSREMDMDFVNLGFSGCGKGEISVAGAIATIEASCYVLDYGQNNSTAEDLERVYLPFIKEIRTARPETPILLSTPVFMSREQWSESHHRYMDAKREVVRNAYTAMLSSGDRNIRLVEGFELLSSGCPEGFVDGVHPNDLGFARMAEGFKRELKEILGI